MTVTAAVGQNRFYKVLGEERGLGEEKGLERGGLRGGGGKMGRERND